MSFYLGIDTSNYTTSAALYNSKSGEMLQQRKLLSVKSGEKGLRQSDALFQHVKQLPEIIEKLTDGYKYDISAVGYSARPRDVQGSYMPCFLAGEMAARSIAASLNVPCFDFSHQAGHVAAAIYSIDKLDLLREQFIAFHVSGGTTDALLCIPSDNNENTVFSVKLIATSLDLKAGQVIDRTGVMLGLDFPAGPELEKLALKSKRQYKIKPCIKECDCCLSGAENKCSDMIKNGESKSDIALFCLEYIKAAIDGMTAAIMDKPGFEKLPLIYAGGVMSNTIISEYISKKYEALFAKPAYSSDNAAGIALLTKIQHDNWSKNEHRF